jgi:hypothetical protein
MRVTGGGGSRSDRCDARVLPRERVALGLDQLVGGVEVLADVVLVLQLELVESLRDDRAERGLGVRKVAAYLVRLGDDADDALARLHLLLLHRCASTNVPPRTSSVWTWRSAFTSSHLRFITTTRRRAPGRILGQAR